MAPFTTENSQATPTSTSLGQTKISSQAPNTDNLTPEISNPSTTTTSPTWQSIAARRAQEIHDSIPSEWYLSPHLLDTKHPVDLVKTCGLLDEREIEIVYSTAVDLLDKMRTREYTAVEVTRAFCKASAVAHSATNCLAWTMYTSALSRAAELDAYMATHGKPIGPLHGLPISVKEHIYLVNTPSTSGFVAWADNFCTGPEQEGECIRILRFSGAIFHVKTTNPQGLMALETVSNLYGTTTNPLNTSLSPGGSSGGESALIAMHGSILGIGTDIGGSIRNPAISCGLYALKPSVARLPHSGLSGAHEGMESVVGVVGPLATCTDDVELFCKTLLDAEPWKREVGLLPIPWGCREIERSNHGFTEIANTTKKLRIGVIYNDAAKLSLAGHTIIPFPTHLHAPLISLIDTLYLLDGGSEYKSTLSRSNEPPAPLLTWLLEKPTSLSRSIPEMWKLHSQRNQLQEEYARLMGEKGLNIDCLIAPGGSQTACKHGEARYWGYTSVFNGLDLPVFCLPVGEVEVGDSWEGVSEGADGGESTQVVGGENRGVKERKRTEIEAQWPEGSEGAEKYKGSSVGLQIVGKRLQEEKLLGMVKIIEGVWK